MEENNVKLLIIEDDPHQRKLYRKILAPQCDLIDEAADGLDAQTFHWPDYDVILLDLLMPGLGGVDTLAWAEQAFGESLPPIVVFTALSNGPLKAIAQGLPSNVVVKQKAGPRDSVLSYISEAISNAVTSSSAGK